MRVASAADLKSSQSKQNNPSGLPHEGTYIREVYDIFKANAGYIIQFDEMTTKQYHRFAAIINQLRDFYGCDIRTISKQGMRKDARQYLLAGEWIGEHYADYVLLRAQGKL